MLETEKEKVYFEYCVSCSTHSWCTRHDESKYSSYFDKCNYALVRKCPEVLAVANRIPLFFRRSFVNSSMKAEPWAGKNTFPRIGAFEVYFRDTVVFSKLTTGRWPQPDAIVDRIFEILHKPPPRKINTRKKVKKYTSNRRVRVIKHKRRKKKGMKAEPFSQFIDHKPRTPGDISFENPHAKSTGKNLFKDLDSSSSKESDSHYQDPVNKSAGNPGLNNYQGSFKKSSEYSSPGESERESDKSSEQKFNLPSDKFPKKLTGQSSDKYSERYSRKSSEKYSERYSRKSSEKYSEDYSKKSSENYSKKSSENYQKKSSENYQKKSSENYPNESSENYPNESSENYPNESSENYSKKSFENDSKQSAENYSQKSSENYSNKSFENYSKKSSEKDSKRSSDKYSDNFSKKSSEKYSESYSENKSVEKYSEEEEKNSDVSSYNGSEASDKQSNYSSENYSEPERKVTKSFELNLPYDKPSNKKIGYFNSTSERCVFVLYSNHAKMVVKEQELAVEPGSKGLIKLRFDPVDKPQEISCLLCMDLEDQEWETMEFKVNYTLD